MFMLQRTLQSVSQDTMGEIVRTHAAVTVYMITYVTGLQDIVNLGVNLDGQETDVINVRLNIYLIKMLKRISNKFLQINANIYNLNRSQFRAYFHQTFFKPFRKIMID